MKVLFVCRANIGRSQTAAGLYNMIHPSQATSAGTKVEPIGQKLSDRPGAANAIIAMKEIGLDMSGNTTTQVTEKMLDNYDKVIKKYMDCRKFLVGPIVYQLVQKINQSLPVHEQWDSFMTYEDIVAADNGLNSSSTRESLLDLIASKWLHSLQLQ